MAPSCSRGSLRLPLPPARQATMISLVLLACFVYVNANTNWFCYEDVYSHLNSLCDGCYAGYDKRTNTITRTIGEEPFVERKNAVDFLKRGTSRGTQRGYVNECCYRNCQVHEMMLYCCEQKQREYYTFFGWLKRR